MSPNTKNHLTSFFICLESSIGCRVEETDDENSGVIRLAYLPCNIIHCNLSRRRTSQRVYVAHDAFTQLSHLLQLNTGFQIDANLKQKKRENLYCKPQQAYPPLEFQHGGLYLSKSDDMRQSYSQKKISTFSHPGPWSVMFQLPKCNGAIKGALWVIPWSYGKKTISALLHA